LGDYVFKDATVATGIIICNKQKLDNYEIRIGTEINTQTGKLKDITYCKVNTFSLYEDYKFNIFLNDLIIPIIDKIKNNKKLENFCFVNRGIEIGKSGEFVSNSEKLGFNKKVLSGSDIGRYFKIGFHYLSYPNKKIDYKNEIVYNQPKIVCKDIRGRFGTLDSENYYTLKTVYNIILKENIVLDLKYILGIYNSKLIDFFHKKYNFKEQITLPRTYIYEVNALPVKYLDLFEPKEKELHDNLVSLVDRILELNKKLHTQSLTSHQKETLEDEIKTTDKQIDALVYQLYGLTEEEIKVVEGNVECLS